MGSYLSHFRFRLLFRRLLPCLVALTLQIFCQQAAFNFKTCAVSVVICFVATTFFGVIGNSILKKLRINSARVRIIVGSIFVWTLFYGSMVFRHSINQSTSSLIDLATPLVLPALIVFVVDMSLKLQDGDEKMLSVWIVPRSNRKVALFVGPVSKHYIKMCLLVFLISLGILKSIFVFGKLDSLAHWLYVVTVPCLVLLTFVAINQIIGKRKLIAMQKEAVSLPEDYARAEFF